MFGRAQTASPYPPAAAGGRKAFGLAVLMHALLLALLAFGLNWQSSPPPGAEAELWDPAMAAVANAVDDAQPDDARPQEATADAEADAEIALRAKKQREQEAKDKAAKDKATKEKAAKEKEAKDKAAKEKAAKEKADKAAKDKTAKDKAAKEKAAKDKAEQEAKDKAAKDKAAKEKDAKDKAAQEKARADQLRRLQGSAAGGTGPAGNGAGAGGGSGASSGSGSASPGYADKIRQRVERYVGQAPAGGLTAVALVRLAPDGTVLNSKIVKPSGNGGWDQAVLRAIDEASPLPKDVGGVIPREALNEGVRITFRSRN